MQNLQIKEINEQIERDKLYEEIEKKCLTTRLNYT